MWSYYGAKTNIIDLYPPPKYGKIIEPFAGTARYALKYHDREILLVDKYDVIVKIWKWLQLCSPGDILSLPRFSSGDNINNHTYNCEEERLLMGFIVGFGFYSPRQTATPRLRNRPNALNYTINRIAGELWKIKNWTIKCDTYENIPNQQATWFIDPPYIIGGKYYKESSKKINFNSLGQWCVGRSGQVMVCERSDSTWLPFKVFKEQNCLSGRISEGLWTNYNMNYKKQLELF